MLSTWILLGAYLVLVMSIGIASRIGETSEGFLISDRNRPAASLGASIVVGWTGGAFIAYFASTTYSYGWAPLVAWCLATIVGFTIFWFMAAKLRAEGEEFNLYMLPDYFSKKYSLRLGFMFLLCNFSIMFAWLMAQFVVGGQLISGITNLSYEYSILVMVLITGPYLVLGGFKAVLNTDTVQFMLLLIIVATMLVAATYTGTGTFPAFETVYSMGSSSFMSIVIMGALWTVASGDMWQRVLAARDTKAAQHSMIWALIFYIVMSFLICVPFLLGGHLKDTVPKEEYLVAALGAALPPSLSFLAALLLFISIMSTIDTAAFGAAMSISNDLALKLNLIKEKYLEFWTKVAIVAVLAVSSVSAVMAPNVVDLVYACMGMAACMAPTILASFFAGKYCSEQSLFLSMLAAVSFYGINFFFQPSGVFVEYYPLIASVVVLLVSQIGRGRA